MAKQILLPLAAVMVFIILVGLFTQKSGQVMLSKFLPQATAKLASKTITVGNKVIQVEVADSEPIREKGLGGRSTLATNSGMLFSFGSKVDNVTFWMKDMLIPLDLIWIDGGKIIKIDKNVPAPTKGTPDNKLAVFTPGKPIDYVLEVNGGFSDKNNIKVGNSVTLPTP